MSINTKKLLKAAFSVCSAAIIIIIGNFVIVAQSMSGTWETGSDRESDGKVHISFSRQSAKGGKNVIGTDFDLAELSGLSSRDIAGSNRKVSFRLVREAGIIQCEGVFDNGKGKGTFNFTADGNYLSAVQNLGFTVDNEKLFSAAVLDITTSQAREVLSMGFKTVEFDDLFKAKIFKITPQFAAEMLAIGFSDLDMEDLVKARIFKIDADYARRVREMGFSDQSMESMVKLSIFKVTPEFIDELRREGLGDLSVEDVVKLRIFKVDAAFIANARAANVPINVESLVNRRIGVRVRN